MEIYISYCLQIPLDAFNVNIEMYTSMPDYTYIYMCISFQRTLPWSEENIELDESDHTNINVILEGVMKNAERLNGLKSRPSNTRDRKRSPGLCHLLFEMC